ncbi:Fe-S cluster assembly protein SufD [Cobetia marina]|jgi:Fe-S cluster assembly protein SufD|uniref:Fe-S cluster assembly protein SufD n=1 Tax=Cobetia marina TaxID=28258 RepID=UPI00384B8D45
MTALATASVPGSEAFASEFAARKARFAADSSWMAARRQAGIARFEALGLPTRKVEAWKYTDTQALGRQQYRLADDANLSAAVKDELALAVDAYRLVFVDGLYNAELSDVAGLPDTVRVVPLSQAIIDQPEVIGGSLNRLTGIDFTPFVALNSAFTEEGAVIQVGPRTVLDKPVYALFLSRAAVEGEPVTMSHPRLLVQLGSRAEASVIEHHIGESGATNFTNMVSEVMLERGAVLNHYKLGEAATGETHIASLQVEQPRDSQYRSINLNTGGGLVRNDIVCDLNGSNAHARLDGLFFGRDRQHVDTHSLVNHNEALTFSDENYKGILADRARGVFNGRVLVKRDSQKIEAHQNNANLLLSDRAEINTKPELEIYADDVKCSHGTTTGQLDETAVFALRARGIDEQTARGLLTLAFANEVMSGLGIDAIAERIERSVAGRLPSRFHLDELVDLSVELGGGAVAVARDEDFA